VTLLGHKKGNGTGLREGVGTIQEIHRENTSKKYQLPPHTQGGKGLSGGGVGKTYGRRWGKGTRNSRAKWGK